MWNWLTTRFASLRGAPPEAPVEAPPTPPEPRVPYKPPEPPGPEQQVRYALEAHLSDALNAWCSSLRSTCPACDEPTLDRVVTNTLHGSFAGGGGYERHDEALRCRECGWSLERQGVLGHVYPEPSKWRGLGAPGPRQTWEIGWFAPPDQPPPRAGVVTAGGGAPSRCTLEPDATGPDRAAVRLAAALIDVAIRVDTSPLTQEEALQVQRSAVSSKLHGARVLTSAAAAAPDPSDRPELLPAAEDDITPEQCLPVRVFAEPHATLPLDVRLASKVLLPAGAVLPATASLPIRCQTKSPTFRLSVHAGPHPVLDLRLRGFQPDETITVHLDVSEHGLIDARCKEPQVTVQAERVHAPLARSEEAWARKWFDRGGSGTAQLFRPPAATLPEALLTQAEGGAWLPALAEGTLLPATFEVPVTSAAPSRVNIAWRVPEAAPEFAACYAIGEVVARPPADAALCFRIDPDGKITGRARGGVFTAHGFVHTRARHGTPPGE